MDERTSRTGPLSRGSVNNTASPQVHPSQPGTFFRTSGPLKREIRWLEFPVGWRQLAPLMLLRLRGEISWASRVLQEERSIHTRGQEIRPCSSTAPAAPAFGWANCRCTSQAIPPNDREPAPPERASAPVPGKTGLGTAVGSQTQSNQQTGVLGAPPIRLGVLQLSLRGVRWWFMTSG
jgi:hypothetical protein